MSWQPELDELRDARAHGPRDGRRRQGQAPARRRPAHGARAHRRAGRPGQLPRDRHHRRQGRIRRPTAAARSSRRPIASWAGRRSTAARSSWSATTSRCAAARPTPPSRRSRSWPSAWPTSCACRSSASSRARAAAARSRPSRPPAAPTCRGSSACRHAATSISPTTSAPCRVVALGLGSVAGPRRGAAGRQPLLGHGEGDLGACSSPGRRWSTRLGPEARQAGAGRLGDPVPGRRGRPRGGHRGGGVRSARAASSPTCPPRSTSVPPRGPSAPTIRPARGVAVRRHPARPPQGLQDAADHRGGGRQGLLLRDGPAVRPRRSSPAWPGSTAAGRGDGERSLSSTAAPGRPTPATRSCASSTWPRPSTCRSSTSATAPAS